jgi:hypothetical protein
MFVTVVNNAYRLELVSLVTTECNTAPGQLHDSWYEWGTAIHHFHSKRYWQTTLWLPVSEGCCFLSLCKRIRVAGVTIYIYIYVCVCVCIYMAYGQSRCIVLHPDIEVMKAKPLTQDSASTSSTYLSTAY